MSDNSRQWTLHYRSHSHSLTVQLHTLLLSHSSSYAADCSRRTKQLLLHVIITHCSRDNLASPVTILASGLFITDNTH